MFDADIIISMVVSSRNRIGNVIVTIHNDTQCDYGVVYCVVAEYFKFNLTFNERDDFGYHGITGLECCFNILSCKLICYLRWW